MDEKVIMWLTCFGCGMLFFGIGAYSKKKKEPMWFWSGSKVDASKITDIKQYNKANGIMWQLYSLWYFAAGVAEIWNTMASAAILVLSCTIGLALLIYSYKRIYKKYSVG